MLALRPLSVGVRRDPEQKDAHLRWVGNQERGGT
jgi:hypothetical protein